MAVDNDKTLKFYDFIDKQEKEKEEQKKKFEEELSETCKKVFMKYDVDGSGRLDRDESYKYFVEVFIKIKEMGHGEYIIDRPYTDSVFEYFDKNKNGTLNRFELKDMVKWL